MDTEREAAVAALPPPERMAYLIGLITQTQVQLEYWLRHVWALYVASGPARFLVPDRFAELLRQCDVLVRNDDYEYTRVRVAVLDIVARAKELNEKRNRFVHDLWFPGYGGADASPQFAFMRFRKNEPHPSDTPRSLADAESLLDEFERLSARASTVPYVTRRADDAGEGFGPGHDSFREDALRVIEGRFDLSPGGGVSPHRDDGVG